MIEIDHPPDIAACSTYAVPLSWYWSPKSGEWESFELVGGTTDTLHRHWCERHGKTRPPYMQLTFNIHPDPALVDRAHAGAAYARREIERAQQREGTSPNGP